MSTPLTRFVARHGKRIEVETLPFEAQPSKARRREADLFSKMPLQWSNAATRAIGSRQCFVLIWLLHLAWKRNAQPSVCPTRRWRDTESAARRSAGHWQSWKLPA